MLSKEIRKNFLNYFKKHSHTIVPSSSVVPHDDPTLLFNNAGMNQFKDVFLGKSKRDYKRATTTQKCIRVGGKHNDLENVGHTSRHLTFFEMLGNFSFGDYFKEEAIKFAHDVVLNVFEFDKKKIWASVYEEDDESFKLWQKYLPSSRIVRFGKEENFWSMGEIGPCGPCSELLYDRGEKYSNANSPLEDLSGERYLEFWNLVFMQFNRKEDGSMTNLPKPCIDTGAGLERILSLKIGVDSVFLTDLFSPIIEKIEEISKIKYNPKNEKTTSSFHVISDHIRTLSFAISDGVLPSNVDRGYVLRKILRRAVRYARKLNLKNPFLKELVPPLIQIMGSEFTNLKDSKNLIEEILTKEEENFISTLNRGGNLLTEIIKKSEKKISGPDAFKLKDTYGFPLEEILLIAKDALLDVDIKTFNELEEKAKERSKKAHTSKFELFDKNFFEDFSKENKPSKFVGYDTFEIDAKIISILKENKFTDKIEEKEKAIIILDKTPFYAEMGGQKADTGILISNKNIFEVTDCQMPYPGVIIHIGVVKKGSFEKKKTVSAKIDKDRREKISLNHTATHLLHWALFSSLKGNIIQKGSFLDEKKLRFDFSYHKGLTLFELREVEEKVNAKIRENLEVKKYFLSFEEAAKDKSIKQIFSEKYSKKVRVIETGKIKELCGGCHTSRLGNIGIFKIKEEKSIASGIRRIEAVVAKEAEKYIYEKEDFILAISEILEIPQTKIFEKLDSILKENKDFKNKLKNQRKEDVKELKKRILKEKEKLNSINIILKEVDLDFQELSSFIRELSSEIPSSLIALATKNKDRCQIIIKVTEDVIEKGILADMIAKEISSIIKGGGGGKMDLAQAGGIAKDKIKEAFEKIRTIVKEKC